jgi:hypothetical protein
VKPFVAQVWLLAFLATSCGGGGGEESVDSPPIPPNDGAPTTRPGVPQPARCPPSVSGCRTASGRIVYVERRDPDGDGDAHFVLASTDGITAPGISVIDVARNLRPRPLPEVGDSLSAAGPVHRGSFGQRQIQAIELMVAE